jgi:hypothetical protein
VLKENSWGKKEISVLLDTKIRSNAFLATKFQRNPEKSIFCYLTMGKGVNQGK